MRGDERQPAMQFAGLVTEGIFCPTLLIVGALDNDFGARRCHDSEETIRVDDFKRGDEAERLPGETRGLRKEHREDLNGSDRDERGRNKTGSGSQRHEK